MAQAKQVRVVAAESARYGQGMEPTAFFDADTE